MSRSLSPLSAIVLAMIAPAALVSPAAADDADLRGGGALLLLADPDEPAGTAG